MQRNPILSAMSTLTPIDTASDCLGSQAALAAIFSVTRPRFISGSSKADAFRLALHLPSSRRRTARCHPPRSAAGRLAAHLAELPAGRRSRKAAAWGRTMSEATRSLLTSACPWPCGGLQHRAAVLPVTQFNHPGAAGGVPAPSQPSGIRRACRNSFVPNLVQRLPAIPADEGKHHYAGRR